MKSKDIAIVGILLAVGFVLGFILRSFPFAIIFGKPLIVMYCLAIFLVLPNIKETLVIGFIAGLISIITVGYSIFPIANIIGEIMGAVVCMAVYSAVHKKIPFMESVSTFFATCVSGFAFLIVSGFIFLLYSGESLTSLYQLFIPMLLITAFINSLVAQVLYFPAKLLFCHDAFNDKNSLW
ncbi:MAG: hypothetical protein JW931_01265 [Methanomicrobiaceae archaeon]|nr:hypothetical protein [Methanomicrobiaceae archaeon]